MQVPAQTSAQSLSSLTRMLDTLCKESQAPLSISEVGIAGAVKMLEIQPTAGPVYEKLPVCDLQCVEAHPWT